MPLTLLLLASIRIPPGRARLSTAVLAFRCFVVRCRLWPPARSECGLIGWFGNATEWTKYGMSGFLPVSSSIGEAKAGNRTD